MKTRPALHRNSFIKTFSLDERGNRPVIFKEFHCHTVIAKRPRDKIRERPGSFHVPADECFHFSAQHHRIKGLSDIIVGLISRPYKVSKSSVRPLRTMIGISFPEALRRRITSNPSSFPFIIISSRDQINLAVTAHDDCLMSVGSGKERPYAAAATRVSSLRIAGSSSTIKTVPSDIIIHLSFSMRIFIIEKTWKDTANFPLRLPKLTKM